MDNDYDNLPPEQKELIDAVDNFAAAMRERLLDKYKEGYTSFEELDIQDITHAIEERVPRMFDDSDNVEIGIANWALIAYIKKQRRNSITNKF